MYGCLGKEKREFIVLQDWIADAMPILGISGIGKYIKLICKELKDWKNDNLIGQTLKNIENKRFSKEMFNKFISDMDENFSFWRLGPLQIKNNRVINLPDEFPYKIPDDLGIENSIY